MNTELQMTLQFGLYNGAMNVDVYVDDNKIAECYNSSEEIFKINSAITLPGKLKFVLSGKNENDTLVKNEKIIADKYVKLNSLYLGRIPINPVVLFKICCLENGSKDTYWGSNGTVEINFNEDDFIVWHLKQNNLFEL